MPTNELSIQRNEELEVKVYDGEGISHDITEAFRSIVGETSPSTVTNTITCQDGTTTLEIGFMAGSKELKFGIAPSVVKQLVALAE